MTAAELSRATGVPQQTITNWLSGMSPRSLPQLKRVADHLGVAFDSLLFEQKKNPHPLEPYKDEIEAGLFEVVLRRVRR